MRKWLSVGIGLLVSAVLLALYFFLKPSSPSQESISQVLPPEKSPVIDLTQVSALELTNNTGRMKFQKNEEGNWEIIEPEPDLPDPFFFDAMLEVLSQLTRIRYVNRVEKDALVQYGLEPGIAKLTFEFKDSKTKKTLRLGNPNPIMNALYAWYEDEPEVFLVQPKIRMFVISSFSELRWRRLANIQAQEAQEFKIVVLDPKLRAELGVPEVRELIKQTSSSGPVWILLGERQGKNDAGQTENILDWMENSSIADDVITIKEFELKKYGLSPPRAYFEIGFPSRQEKILVGNEKDAFIYIKQEFRPVILVYKKDTILNYLASDFRSHQLISWEDLARLNKIELIYPEGKSFYLSKLDQKFWTINGEPGKRFQAEKVRWVAEQFISLNYQWYIRENPINWEKYGLKNPRIKLKFFNNEEPFLEIWVGKWDPKERKCYTYIKSENFLTWYPVDLMEEMPPEASVFLRGEKSEHTGGK